MRTLGLCLASEVMLWGVTNSSLTTDTLGDRGTDYVALYPSKHIRRQPSKVGVARLSGCGQAEWVWLGRGNIYHQHLITAH